MNSILLQLSSRLRSRSTGKRLSILLSFLLGYFWTGCTTETREYPIVDSEEVNIEFTLEVPGQSIPTRAMSSNDESAIETIDILVFQVDGNNETFAYRAHQTSQPVVTGNTASFLVTLKRSTADESYRLVLLANLREEVDAVLESVAEGDSKASVLTAITFAQTGNWPTASGSKRPLPMWGETSGHTAVARTTTLQHFGGTISLLRSVARVDINLNLPQGNDQPGFTARRVKVYNAHQINAAAPGTGAGYNHTAKKVYYPTVVSGAVLSPLDYAFNGTSLTNEIYIGESNNSQAAPNNNLFLLVEGFYTEVGQPQNTTKSTWYRIDFVDENSDPAVWYDILRNHRYQVNIKYVGGPGDEDEDEAIRRGNYNMDTEVLVWSEGTIRDVVWEGQYYLGVSQSRFDLNKPASTHSLLLSTNYPKGWIPSVDPQYASWLEIVSGEFTYINTLDELFFRVTENTDGQTRTGYIDLTCGNLRHQIMIVQDESEYSGDGEIYIRDQPMTGDPVYDLYFTSGLGERVPPLVNQQMVFLSWAPAVNCYSFFDTYATMKLTLGNEFHGQTFRAELSPAPNGLRWVPEFYDPTDIENNPFLEKDLIVFFTLIDDHPVIRTLHLHQINYNLLTDHEEKYLMDGSNYTFTVRCNAPWTAEVVSGGTNLIASPSGWSGPANTEGQEFQFRIIDDSEGSIGDASTDIRFTYTGKDNNTYVTTITINGYSENDGGGELDEIRDGIESNCYLLLPAGHPESQGVNIPVVRANRDGTIRINDGDQLQAEFIWTDHPNGVAADAAVSGYRVVGSGPGALLEVTPGSESGNAVIGVRNMSTGGNIVWSWHIWVSNFDPDDDTNDFYTLSVYEFLDRNLGSLSEDPTNYRSQGLFYQWGRKDPFPYAASLGGSSFITIYDEHAQPISVTTTSATTGIMLEHSIRHPLEFITSSDADWYSTNYTNATSAERRAMWHPGATYTDVEKGVYDPCPEGWRVVPGDNGGNPIWYSVFSVRTHYPTYSDVSGNLTSTGQFADLGLWPHAGYIAGSGSGQRSFTEGGQNGYYWTSNVNGSWSTGSLYVGLKPATTEVANDFQRRNALSVRCMRKTE